MKKQNYGAKENDKQPQSIRIQDCKSIKKCPIHFIKKLKKHLKILDKYCTQKFVEKKYPWKFVKKYLCHFLPNSTPLSSSLSLHQR
jgi:hypothetical protein